MAKKFHPDASGKNSDNKFHVICEAYEVLSNPDRRKDHDRQLDREHRKTRPTGSRSRSYDFEPSSRYDEWEFFGINPLDEMLGRGRDTGYSGHDSWSRGLVIELVLSPEEAHYGGVMPLQVPISHPCDYCGGSGEDWPYACQSCDGTGVFQEYYLVELDIPPGLRHGQVYEVPVSGLDQYLEIHVRISRYY